MNHMRPTLLCFGICLGLWGCSGETKAPPEGTWHKAADQAKKSESTPKVPGTPPTKIEKKEPVRPNLKEPHEGIDPDDPSVVYDEPFTMVGGYKTFNGTAYDKAYLWIDPSAKLVLPNEDTEVIRQNDTNAVIVYMQKRITHYSHGGDQNHFPIARHRAKMGCAAKLEKGALLIGTFGEYYYLEGAVMMKLVVQAPAKLEVVRMAGLNGGGGGRAGERLPGLINPGPREPRPALTKKKEGRPEYWLAPAVEDGWHEIPAVPDRERRAQKKN